MVSISPLCYSRDDDDDDDDDDDGDGDDDRDDVDDYRCVITRSARRITTTCPCCYADSVTLTFTGSPSMRVTLS